MERGRILIMGQSKESTYELRNLLDNRRFELEIALSQEVGKQVLSVRRMSMIMIHTEMLSNERDQEFFQFLSERDIGIPVLVIGEAADTLRSRHRATSGEVHFFPKPYTSTDVLSCIDNL